MADTVLAPSRFTSVNPEGVMGEPVPVKSVAHIRGTFNRMVRALAVFVCVRAGGATCVSL